MVYGKTTKGLPPIMRPKLSKKSQEIDDEIKKKLYTAIRNWNYWKSQLHRNKLDCVNLRSKPKIKNLLSFFKEIYINKDLRTAHWVGHSPLK